MRAFAVTLAVILAVGCSGDEVELSTTTAITTTVPVETTFTLPGEEVESMLQPGDVVGVIGAADDVTHWLYSFAGEFGGVVREVQPTETGLEAMGQAWMVDDVRWERVRLEEHEGFLPGSMLAFIAPPEDVTAQFSPLLAGTAEALALEVAGEIEAAETVLVAAPSAVEMIYDVLGLGDDAIAGYRIRVIATETADGFAPELVERSPLCVRGWDSDSGLCL